MKDEYRVGYHGVFAGGTERPERGRFGRSTLPAVAVGESGELAVRRGASREVRLVAFVLSFALLVGMVLFDQRAASAAQDPVVAISMASAQEKYGCPEEERPFEAGGSLCVSDWVAYLPLGAAAIFIVVVVDAFALFIIFRRRRRGEELA